MTTRRSLRLPSAPASASHLSVMIWSGTLLNAVWPLFDSDAERLELAMLLWCNRITVEPVLPRAFFS